MPRALREELRKALGEAADLAYGAFDFIGDIAVIKVPPELLDRKEDIARAVMSVNRSVKSVWVQVGPVSGEYRKRELVFGGGERRSETVYRESGCRFLVDVRKSFFTPRLSAERLRIAGLVKDGESVFNMFAGVGTYSIIIASRRRGVKVYSSEINPDAFYYMIRNISINHVEGSVVPLLMDAARAALMLEGSVDRVIMPYPELALQYMPYAVRALRGHGQIHVYLHVRQDRGESQEEALRRSRELIGVGQVVYSRVVREVGPRLLQVVHDVAL